MMKPIHWDVLAWEDRLALLRQWDFYDLCKEGENSEDVRRRIAKLPWEKLPPEIRMIIRATPGRI